jgi:hypothetical protein
MDSTRKSHQEAPEATLQYKSRQESLLDDELTQAKLTRLLIFLGQLEGTSEGTAEVKHRIKSFGTCKRDHGETSAEFYAKLRHWLDRDMPPEKSPLRALRQTHR